MGIIAFIILGLLAGALAKAVLPGEDPGGFIITALIGVAGALIGGFLAGALFNADPLDEFFDVSTWLTASRAHQKLIPCPPRGATSCRPRGNNAATRAPNAGGVDGSNSPESSRAGTVNVAGRLPAAAAWTSHIRHARRYSSAR